MAIWSFLTNLAPWGIGVVWRDGGIRSSLTPSGPASIKAWLKPSLTNVEFIHHSHVRFESEACADTQARPSSGWNEQRAVDEWMGYILSLPRFTTITTMFECFLSLGQIDFF
jgi:hypothetical protein